jgi:lipoprotein-releasing system ATP-binding protein
MNPSMTEPVSLSVTGLEKRYETPGRSAEANTGEANTVEVLAGIDLAMEAGEALAITGPSGSGKSTLLHIIGTLDRPSAGRVEIGNTDPFALSEPELARFRNHTIGFVFQDHYLLPHLSVLENVLLPTLAQDSAAHDTAAHDTAASASAGADRARELLDRVGLGHRLEHRPAELSGGERQRAAVARALINQPRLVLCDEPTGSLDHDNAQAVGDLLVELHAQSQAILIVVTHSSELAQRFARRASITAGHLRDTAGASATP